MTGGSGAVRESACRSCREGSAPDWVTEVVTGRHPDTPNCVGLLVTLRHGDGAVGLAGCQGALCHAALTGPLVSLSRTAHGPAGRSCGADRRPGFHDPPPGAPRR